jgi:hypothetical protein
MAFGIKHVLLAIAVVAIGLAALLNAGTPFVSESFSLFTLVVLIGAAYGIWMSNGETRAFRIGFVAWSALYYWLFSRTFDIGTGRLLYLASIALGRQQTTSEANDDLFGTPFQAPSPYVDFQQGFTSIGHCLFLLIFGLIGGCVTVYFYRKRQRMQETRL